MGEMGEEVRRRRAAGLPAPGEGGSWAPGGTEDPGQSPEQEEVLALEQMPLPPSSLTIRKLGLLPTVTSSLREVKAVDGRSCVLGAPPGLAGDWG